MRKLLLLAIAAFAMPAMAQTKIVLGYTPANAFMPAFVAKDKGFFANRGLDVTLQTVPQGSTIARAMAGGSMQVGTLTAPAYLLSVEGGIDTQIVAASTYQVKSNPTVGLMARANSNIKSAADMKGKRMGVPGLNGVNHVVAMKWLENNGVPRDNVTYVETGFAQMGDLLKGGQVDVVVPVEPFITRIEQTKVGYVVALPAIPDSFLESFYTMRRDFIQQNPKAAREFREAIRDALAYIK